MWPIERLNQTHIQLVPALFAIHATGKDRRHDRNVTSLRKCVSEMVRDRRASKSASQGADKDNQDLLDLLIRSDYYDNTDKIVDELLTFFLGGLFTVQTTTACFLMLMETHPEYKEKLLKEIIPPLE